MSNTNAFWHTTESRPNGLGKTKQLIVVRGLCAKEVAKTVKVLGQKMAKAYPNAVERVGTYARKDGRFPEYGEHFYSVIVLRCALTSQVAERVGKFLAHAGIVHLCQLGLTQEVEEQCSALVVYVPVDVYKQRQALREVLNRNSATVKQLVDYLARRGFKVPRKSRKADLLQMVATLEG